MAKDKQTVTKQPVTTADTTLVNSKETLDALIQRVKKAQKE